MNSSPRDSATDSTLSVPGPSLGRQSRQTGYSIVEVLVVMVILLIVMTAVYGVWLSLGRTYAFAEEDQNAQTQARAAMAEMVEFIRTTTFTAIRKLGCSDNGGRPLFSHNVDGYRPRR